MSTFLVSIIWFYFDDYYSKLWKILRNNEWCAKRTSYLQHCPSFHVQWYYFCCSLQTSRISWTGSTRAWECRTVPGTRPLCTRSWRHTKRHQSTWVRGRWWGYSRRLPWGWRKGCSIECPPLAPQTERNTHNRSQTPLETASSAKHTIYSKQWDTFWLKVRKWKFAKKSFVFYNLCIRHIRGTCKSCQIKKVA